MSATSRAKAIWGDDDHGGLLLGQPPDHHLQTSPVSSGSRAEVARQAQHIGLEGQGPGDGHALLLSAGELDGGTAPALAPPRPIWSRRAMAFSSSSFAMVLALCL